MDKDSGYDDLAKRQAREARRILTIAKRAIHKIEVERGRGRDYRHLEVEDLLAERGAIEEFLAIGATP